MNGIDEDDSWPVCGFGPTKRFMTKTDPVCEEVFLCQMGQETKYVEFQDLCDGKQTCGQEKGACQKSHEMTPTFDKVLTTFKFGKSEKRLMYCLQGLKDIQQISKKCVKEVNLRKQDVFGVVNSEITVVYPNKMFICDYTFGELYVILSCSGRCKNSSCPLKETHHFDACPQQYPNRVYTVAQNSFLTFVTKTRHGYTNDIFVCRNSLCIAQDKVCNVVDDCGDGSDEETCTNVFRCHSKERFIPVTEKCDGTVDCLDFSDECNSECGKNIVQQTFLKVMCWFLGILAVLFNLMTICRTWFAAEDKNTTVMRNRLLVFLISVGDFLMGVNLLLLAVNDTIVYGANYCSNQLIWLSSFGCSVIGVISTIGSQMSLLSMTVLSTVRVAGVNRKNTSRRKVKNKAILQIVSVMAAILLISVTAALVPLVPYFEDFFVNGMTYKPSVRLFIGAPGKEAHLGILQEYYGKIKSGTLSWRIINDLIDGMFSNDYGGDVLGRKKLEFYGNDGVCLFKFFVKPNDPQRFYTWTILAMNMLCFIIISISYIYINITANAASQKIGNKNRKLQQKISLIIATDFLCWLPIVIACCLHSSEVINATPWYPIISIVFLPINSVINPLLYNDFVANSASSLFKWLETTLKPNWAGGVPPGEPGDGIGHPTTGVHVRTLNRKSENNLQNVVNNVGEGKKTDDPVQNDIEQDPVEDMRDNVEQGKKTDSPDQNVQVHIERSEKTDSPDQEDIEQGKKTDNSDQDVQDDIERGEKTDNPDQDNIEQIEKTDNSDQDVQDDIEQGKNTDNPDQDVQDDIERGEKTDSPDQEDIEQSKKTDNSDQDVQDDIERGEKPDNPDQDNIEQIEKADIPNQDDIEQIKKTDNSDQDVQDDIEQGKNTDNSDQDVQDDIERGEKTDSPDQEDIEQIEKTDNSDQDVQDDIERVEKTENPDQDDIEQIKKTDNSDQDVQDNIERGEKTDSPDQEDIEQSKKTDNSDQDIQDDIERGEKTDNPDQEDIEQGKKTDNSDQNVQDDIERGEKTDNPDQEDIEQGKKTDNSDQNVQDGIEYGEKTDD